MDSQCRALHESRRERDHLSDIVAAALALVD
jgi:hypothetical protein